MIASAWLLGCLTALLRVATARDCPHILSCTVGAEQADPCCVPSPGGLIVFRQRFEPDKGSDEGTWGVDGLEVLDCAGQTSQDLQPFGPSYQHEEIASFCLRSDVFGGQRSFDQAEGEWAQSEVGEGVEEVWERSWNTAGRFISTIGPSCMPAGQGVASFFHTLHKLHSAFPTADLLSNADISPSPDTTYTLAEILDALKFKSHQPIVECDNMTLSSVLWPLQIQDTFQGGFVVPSFLLERKSSCPVEGIIFPPATTRPAPTTSHTWDPITRPTPRAISLDHDDSKLYFLPEQKVPQHDPRRLGVFKAGDEDREEDKEGRYWKRYRRDEL
ncbi:hypothetical protein BD324DRAFT_626649 [Kockovaella imperatae]|uniref:Uncharacterized protein n=1 Tax=Kockovaella imperatae TaxID=4999 RepID=A0A1Y1UF49_9TREE|nr:hypothetical protein BD324DRAFT_626649 [Kockovaella imperatae]ORX36642.1 hypothetical protein BD324DRAFT_626649 [Kockovaella imperatae]